MKQIIAVAVSQIKREQAKDRLAKHLGCTREHFDEIQHCVNQSFGEPDSCIIKRLNKLADPDFYLDNQ